LSVATALTLPASSWIFSVTVIVNDEPFAGRGGGGSMLQLNAGIVNCGPVVVCARSVVRPYVQSHATIVLGAVDVLPLKVQSIALPLLVSTHVSVSCGPLTPKLAVAVVGRVTESVADAEAPPYEPLMVAAIVPPTVRVTTVNVAVAAPAGTVTLGGTVTGSALDRDTIAPPAGAAPLSVTVAFTVPPPTTVDALSVIEDSVAPRVTVNAGDCPLLPLSVAVIVAVPLAMAVTVNGALMEPAAIAIGVCTVATAGLLLARATFAPPAGAAAARVTAPWVVDPATTVDALSVTLATVAPPLVGVVGELELEH
jgi:hypothetical protein